MRKRMTTLMMVLWVVMGLQSVCAQERFEGDKAMYIELRFDESGFETMKRTVGEKGISPTDLGAWMERSGNVMIKIESAFSTIPPHQLTVFTIDSRGMMTGKESTQVQISERPTSLGQTTRGMMSRLTGGLMAFDAFMAVDMFIPQMDYADSPQTAEKLMVNVAQQAIRTSRSEMAMVVMIVPDQQKYDSRVSPGVAIFTGSGI